MGAAWLNCSGIDRSSRGLQSHGRRSLRIDVGCRSSWLSSDCVCRVLLASWWLVAGRHPCFPDSRRWLCAVGTYALPLSMAWSSKPLPAAGTAWLGIVLLFGRCIVEYTMTAAVTAGPDVLVAVLGARGVVGMLWCSFGYQSPLGPVMHILAQVMMLAGPGDGCLSSARTHRWLPLFVAADDAGRCLFVAIARR